MLENMFVAEELRGMATDREFEPQRNCFDFGSCCIAYILSW